MGWERGRYYTRSKKVDGRVVREYVGTGPTAELAAQLDAIKRQECHLDALVLRQEKAALETLNSDMQTLMEMVDLAARAALLAAGFHQHNRGEWRKRRE